MTDDLLDDYIAAHIDAEPSALHSLWRRTHLRHVYPRMCSGHTQGRLLASDCVVIIPMYNERENAAAVIDAVLALEHGFDVLVIDDNSPDGTADIVKAKMAEHPGRVLLTERTGKLGLGTAYIEGFRRALAEGYGYVFEMDADFSHNPADLERLRRACAEEGADVAVGSRYLTGVNVVRSL